ncbi:C-X-C motif chemokine 16 [Carlito syrichta]|uniref:C-X-C motif chemokine 16 n=1 Tax=Carlito syrichta TaxID=1868482 RepID=A0A3Q0DKL1_CARSF|nr:C-X-C motif chemokine 16 [Carlito syrichta]
MGPGWRPGSRALLLLLLAWLTVPGDGNEGSATGSCRCDKIFPSNAPPSSQEMDRLRRRLKAYHRCSRFVRFQLHSWTVCGGSSDKWVQELMSCFDHRECGYTHSGSLAHEKHLRPHSTRISKPSEKAPSAMGTPAQTLLPATLQSTQHSTLPPGSPSLDKGLTLPNEFTTSTVGHSLKVGPEAGTNQMQLEEKAGPTIGAVLLLILIIFTAVLMYVCKKRRRQSLQSSLGKLDL